MTASNNSANNEEKIVLFNRDNAEDIDDVWDDTALIKAYEKSVKKIKKVIKSKTETSDNPDVKSLVTTQAACTSEQASKKLTVDDELVKKDDEEESESENVAEFEWTEGDLCTAVYTEDGLIYPATIHGQKAEDQGFNSVLGLFKRRGKVSRRIV